jgi:hypothetical protein
VGSVQLQLSAAPTPGNSMAKTILQLASGFVLTPHTLNLHTSAVATMGRAERGAAVGGVVRGWMIQQGQLGVEEPLMQQVRARHACVQYCKVCAVLPDVLLCVGIDRGSVWVIVHFIF